MRSGLLPLLHLPTGTSSVSYCFSAFPCPTIFVIRSGWIDSRTSTPPARGGYGGRGGFGDRSTSGQIPSVAGGGNRRPDSWADRPVSTNSFQSSPKPDSGPRESFGFGVWRDGKHVA